MNNTPKQEQKAVMKKMKEDRTRKLALLSEQYESSISEMTQQQTVRSLMSCATFAHLDNGIHVIKYRTGPKSKVYLTHILLLSHS